MPMQTVRRPNLPVRIVIIGLLAVLIAVFIQLLEPVLLFLERVEETESASSLSAVASRTSSVPAHVVMTPACSSR